MDSNNIPLSVIMEQAKARLIMSFNQIIDESKLPAFLVEGMLSEFMSEVRNRKNIELISDINKMQKNAEEAEEQT